MRLPPGQDAARIQGIGQIQNRTNMTDSSSGSSGPGFISPHGGYEKLQSYQMSILVYDATVKFCDRFVDPRSRTHDQMVQAARSGNKNIAEGSMVSGTSKKMEIKLVGVARASLEELLGDYRDFLRHHGQTEWGKDHPMSAVVRRMAYAESRSFKTYSSHIENAPAEVAANTMLCLVHQTNYLLDQQLRRLEQAFLNEGGFTERLYQARQQARALPPRPTLKRNRNSPAKTDTGGARGNSSYQSYSAVQKPGAAKPPNQK
jgi:restriction system protein